MTSALTNKAVLYSAISITAGLVFASHAQSAQITWTGAAGDSNWQTSGNWSGTAPINNTSTALFTDTGAYNSPTAATIDANGTFSIGEIQFATTTSGTTPPITLNNSQNGIITLTGATGLLVQTKQTNAVTINSNLALANAATGNVTTFNITQATSVLGTISGSGNFLKIGNAALTLKGANTYTGATVIQQNTVDVASNAPAGSAGALGNATTPIQLGNSSTLSTQTVSLLTTGKFTVGRDVVVGPVVAGATLSLGGTQAGTSTYSGQVTLNSPANLQSSTTGTSVVDFTGQITGSGGITKTNNGTVQLDYSNNDYQGGTAVKAGTLLVNGAITGGGPVAVTVGTLGGTGSITTGTGANGLSVANGTTVAPGLAAGGTASSAAQFTVNGDATFDGTLSIQADTAVSALTTTGALNLNPDSMLLFTGTSALSGTSYVIASYSSLNGQFGTITNQPAGYTLDYDYNGQDEIALVSSPAPEPGVAGIFVTSAAGLLLNRRRTSTATFGQLRM